MKTCGFFIFLISSWAICGCSTSVPKYEHTPLPVPVKNESEDVWLEKANEPYARTKATADLFLETKDGHSFEETGPVYGTAELETIGRLLHGKNLPGHGVAVVLFPEYSVNPTVKVLADLRQALRDAGFVEVHFFARTHYLVIAPIL